MIPLALQRELTLWRLIELKMELLIQCVPAFLLAIQWRGLRAAPTLAGLVVGTLFGVGFTLALTILGVIRELLGAGTLLNIQIMPREVWADHAWVIMILPPGAFLTLGVVVGVVNYIGARGAKGGA